VNPLIFARVLFAAFCAASIIAFYYFADSFSYKKPIAETARPVAEKIIAPVIPADELSLKENKKVNIVHRVKRKETVIEKNDVAVEEIEPLPAKLTLAGLAASENKKLSDYHSDVIYIYDLKIVNYNQLYFHYRNHAFEMKGHTPSFKEGKNSPDYLSENELSETIPADKILKTGLVFFTKERYSKALEQFLLLMQNNSGDENALFYGGVCCYKLGKYASAIRSFEKVLQDPHSVFYEEAKWNLALADLKTGEKGKALELLASIVNEKGFYAKKAAEKLKSL
jgi:tetratricopeptide (TPR) repeat protein